MTIDLSQLPDDNEDAAAKLLADAGGWDHFNNLMSEIGQAARQYKPKGEPGIGSHQWTQIGYILTREYEVSLKPVPIDKSDLTKITDLIKGLADLTDDVADLLIRAIIFNPNVTGLDGDNSNYILSLVIAIADYHAERLIKNRPGDAHLWSAFAHDVELLNKKWTDVGLTW